MKKLFRISAIFLAAVLLFSCLELPVQAQTAERYDAALEGVLSEYYRVDRERGYISGIAPGTSARKLLNACVPAELEASGETVATGTVIQSGELSLTAIVAGDLNGDGAVTISDLLKQKTYLLGQELSPVELAAGDLNGDGSVTITDFLKVKAFLLGLESIQTVYNGGNLFLMEPEKTASWQTEGAANYSSDDPDLFTVDSAGVLSASAREGSAFVYALAEDGSILARQLVTVLAEPVTFSLGMDSCKLIKGQTLTITPAFNHPVSPAVTWASSDEAVVTVESGHLTGVNYGTATVTAALENGFRVELSVTVMPPITGVSFEKSLYKIKPNHSRLLTLMTAPADSDEEFIWTTSDSSIATVSADGTVSGVNYGTVTITATGRYSGLSASCQVKICDVIQVAMTFDDGPSGKTGKLLDFLKENDIKVTFFLVGNRLNTFKDTLKREAAEGHELGYHSYDHSQQTGLSSEKVKADFAMTDQLLYDITGRHFTLWRTPGGGFSERVLECVPLPHIMWSVDTLDWKKLNSYAVYQAIMRARDGDIILMHDLYGTTVDGAIRAMEEMLAGDYEFLTVTELLSRDGTPPEPSKNYYSGR